MNTANHSHKKTRNDASGDRFLLSLKSILIAFFFGLFIGGIRALSVVGGCAGWGCMSTPFTFVAELGGATLWLTLICFSVLRLLIFNGKEQSKLWKRVLLTLLELLGWLVVFMAIYFGYDLLVSLLAYE